MNFSHRRLRRLAGFATLGAASLVLSGCNNEKFVATIGTDTLKEKDWLDRATRLTADQIPNGTDAGGGAFITIIREQMTAQLAKQKNAEVSEDRVSKFRDYQAKRDVRLRFQIEKGQVTQEELNRGFRFTLQEVGIGTEGAKSDAKKVEEEYNSLKAQPAIMTDPTNPLAGGQPNPVKRPTTYVVRLVPAPSEAIAKQMLEILKTTGDFKKAARLVSGDPNFVQSAGTETFLPKDNLLKQAPGLEKAFSQLTDGQYTPAPVVTPVNNPQNPNVVQNSYIVGQLVRKDEEYLFTVEEARIVLELRTIIKDHPDWMRHKEQEMAKYTQKLLQEGRIQIHVPRYQSIRDNFVKSMAESMSATAPGGTLSPTAPGATPPPTGGGQPAPSGGAR